MVVRTTNSRIHDVGAVTHVVPAEDVPVFVSHKLALQRETIGKGHLDDTGVITARPAKTSNISAPNRASSSEVLAVKQMSDIAFDARTAD
jgi:hypothetical protein